MTKPIRLIIRCWQLLLIIPILALSVDPVMAGELEELLPTVVSSIDIKLSGSPRKAVGEELFQLINGGAVLYFQHQFKRALFQEYETKDGKLVNVEIYQMGAPADAQAIFLTKKGDQGKPITIGEAAVVADYYLLFTQGPYFVTITGEEATSKVRDSLVKLARQVYGTMKTQATID